METVSTGGSSGNSGAGATSTPSTTGSSQGASRTNAPGNASGNSSGSANSNTGTQGPSFSNGSGKSEIQGQNANPQTMDGISNQDYEEIALGGVKRQVPKDIAKVIKDMERGMHAKFQEFARVQKQAQEHQQLLHMLRENPDEFAKRTGMDLDDFAEQRLARKYELMTATPEQRELFETRQKLSEYQSQEMQSKRGVVEEIQNLLGADAPKELEKYPKEELQAFLHHQKQVYEQQHQQLDQEIAQAWSEVGLPKNKYFGALMSFHMLNHQKRTGEVLPAAQAASKVKQDFLRSVGEIVASMDPSGIQEVLGKETIEKLRQFDIDRVSAHAASKVGVERPGFQPASEAPKKYLNQLEWRKAMGIG